MLKFISVLAVRPFKSLMYDFVIDIYSTVAKVYDLLLDLASGNFNIYSFDKLLELSSAIYVLMGIFMLFRITVSFLNMLIDPDKVNDKQAGAGSIIKRFIISIIMLLLFQPDSFVFRPNDGLLDRLQNGILNDLIPNILSVSADSETHILNQLIISDVYADDTKKTFDCAYYQVFEGGTLVDDDCYGDTCRVKGNLTIGNVVLLTIGKNKNEVCNGNGKCVTVKKLGVAGYGQGEVGWYAYFNTGDVTDGSGNTYNLSSNLGKFDFQSILHITQGNADKYFATGTCPPSILPLTVKGNGAKFSNKKNSATSGRWQYTTVNNLTNDMEETISNFLDDNPASSSEDISDTSGNLEVEKTLTGGLSFAQSVLKSFISQNSLTGGDSSDVNEKLNSLLLSNESNEDVYDLISAKNPKLTMDFFISMLTGIAIIVYLLFVCIDVIVRNFKLILLEVIAPIPAISYIDPKDKIFSQWLKMFVSVYIDLFLKIIVIKIGVSLVKDVFSIKASLTTFQTILYVAAIFVFIKAVPSLINKLFGIDASASSFKEIGNVMKRGAGMAIGGVATAVGGAISGGIAGAAVQGGGFKKFGAAALGALTGGFTGGIRGVGSGYSGRAFGALNTTIAQNAQLAAANRAGSTFFGRLGANAQHAIGARDAYERAKATYEGNNAFKESAEATESMALDIARKQAGNGHAGVEFSALRQAQDDLTNFRRGADIYDDNGVKLSETELESRLKKAEKKARERIINDTRSGVFAGYVDGYGSANDLDARKLENSIQSTETLGEQIGTSMFKDKDGNNTNTWQKDRRDEAEVASIRAKGEMSRHQANHDAITRGNA